MTYAIIGAGKLASALARRFADRAIPAAIATRGGPASIAANHGAGITSATLDMAMAADVIILAIPFVAVAEFARGRHWAGKLVIDATNAYGVAPEALAGRPSSELVAEAVPGARVVKAFNHLAAGLLAQHPNQHGGRRVAFISGNDDAANAEVKALAEQLGFAPILLGRLDEGGRLQHIPGPLVLGNLVEHAKG